MANNEALVRREEREPTGLALRAKQALSVYNSTGSGIASLASFVFPGLSVWEGSPSGSIEGRWLGLARRDFPYENVNAYNSSVVMACVNAIVAGFKQAPPRIYRTAEDGTKIPLPNHRLARLWKRPNPFYSRSKLLGAALCSYLIKGEGFIYRERADNGVGATRALYYMPYYAVIPKRPIDGSSYVSHYEYNVDGRTYRLRPDQVIHLKWELNEYDTLRGRSPLQPVLSTIYADEEADRFTSALLRNSAIPGVTIIPDTDKVVIKPADAEAIKEAFIRKFGGDKRGEPLVMNFAAKVAQMGFNPEQLQMRDARRLPEERVSAQYRIAASFAGLGAGLDRSTYSNYEQAEKKSYETGIVPLWDEWGDDLTTAFSAEFFAEDDRYGLEFDYSRVKALSENADAVATRSSKIWVYGGMDLAEYRTANGLPVDEKIHAGVYYHQLRAAQTAPNSITGGKPQPSAPNGSKGTLRERAARVLMLKAAPAANLDQAYDLSLEADVTDVARVFENELEEMLEELGEKAQAASLKADRDNPEAEGERIATDILKTMGIAALLSLLWGRMADEITDGVKISIALRLALPFSSGGDSGRADFSSVWDDNAERAAKAHIREAVTSYEDALRKQTREAIAEALKGAERGEAISTIARRIKGQVSGRAMYPGIYQEAYDKARQAGATDEQAARAGESKARRYRANLIAEAETRTFQNVAALESMAVSGVVEKVKVVDGSACGWRYHEDQDRADGTTRLLSEARQYPVVHPRCRRRFYPVQD